MSLSKWAGAEWLSALDLQEREMEGRNATTGAKYFAICTLRRLRLTAASLRLTLCSQAMRLWLPGVATGGQTNRRTDGLGGRWWP